MKILLDSYEPLTKDNSRGHATDFYLGKTDLPNLVPKGRKGNEVAIYPGEIHQKFPKGNLSWITFT